MSKNDEFDIGEGGAPEPIISRRQARRQRMAARRTDRAAGGLGWLAGSMLLAIGVLYMLQTLGLLPPFDNWWALFLLIPALGCFSAALGAQRRNDGHISGEVVGLLVAGLLFVGLTAVFYFDLDIRIFGPLFMIIAGFLLLMRQL
jgi:hypothetical protein